MAKRMWSAEEFEKLSRTEQDAAFAAGIEWTLDEVPPEFLDRVRRMAASRLDERDTA